MSDYIVVLTTTNSKDLANTIAGDLIQTEVAACVNIIPNITSVYKWEGRVHTDPEWLLVIKSRAEHFERIRARIQATHTYDVPEIIALPIVSGDPGYLRWISAVTPAIP